jgi:Bacterial regulatory helix-turn-helix protein, lysR family
VVGETERFGIRCGGDAVEEHPGDRRRPVLDLAYVGPLLVSAQVCHGASLGRPSPAGGRFGKASGTGTTLVFTSLPYDYAHAAERRMLELSALEVLLAIAQTGRFSAAGRELGLTQQAVSVRLHGCPARLRCPIWQTEVSGSAGSSETPSTAVCRVPGLH